MNWDEVWEEGVLPAIEGDTEIQSVVGSAIYLAGTREYESPSLNAFLIVDSEGETWAPADWQFDAFGKTAADVRTVGRALRRLFHHEVQYELGPFLLWSELLEGRGLEGPNEDGDFRYSLDFRFTPGRSLYLTDQES